MKFKMQIKKSDFEVFGVAFFGLNIRNYQIIYIVFGMAYF
jgi:hypothetical protein